MQVSTCLFALCSAVLAAPRQENLLRRATGSLTSWLAAESPIALQGVLNNIGPNGVDAPGADSGMVVASPDQVNPDYFYSWTRDSALTFKCLTDQFLAYGTSGLEAQIRDYVNAQAAVQTIENPSGGLCTGGLGEPKFYLNQTAFFGPWGRPQRDGPALRATALIAYARYLISQGESSSVSSIIWPIVQNDLSYVTQYWNDTTFDLWEEIDSSSFWTTAVQYRALIEGNTLAGQIGESCSNCVSQAPNVLCFLQSYWNGEYIVANTGGGRSGKDSNTILASIHVFDPDASCDDNTFQPCSDKMLANHKVLTDSFRSIYSINSGISEGSGVAVGRYPEDTYQGGNPWYLCTMAAAELLYDAVYQWKRIGSLNVTSTSLAFFQAIYPSAAVGTYSSSSSTFDSIIDAVMTYGDSYMLIAEKYTPSNGSLSEQFSKTTGSPLSAYDLTWSFAAFLTAYNARAAAMPASWGAASASLPSSCSGSSASGPCSTATATFTSGTLTPTCSAQPSTTVIFNELVTTTYGTNIYLTGDNSELGNWSTGSEAVPCSASAYTSTNPLWYCVATLPAGTDIQYKFIQVASDGTVTWESGSNREYTVPSNCAGVAEVNDSWQ